MPFFDGKTLLYCQAGPPVEHTFECAGTIWDRLAHDEALRRHFAGVSRTFKASFRRWKLHFADWKTRRGLRITTGLPAEAVECMPTMYVADGIYHVSFIGGIPSRHRTDHHLYELAGPSLSQLGPAVQVSAMPTSVGFVGPRITCVAVGTELHLHDRASDSETVLSCPVARVKAVSYQADDDESLVITGMDKEAKPIVFCYHVGKDETLFLESPRGAYKPSCFADTLVFGSRRFKEDEPRELQFASFKRGPAAAAIRRANKVAANHPKLLIRS
jgi:hypothetical protein